MIPLVHLDLQQWYNVYLIVFAVSMIIWVIRYIPKAHVVDDGYMYLLELHHGLEKFDEDFCSEMNARQIMGDDEWFVTMAAGYKYCNSKGKK